MDQNKAQNFVNRNWNENVYVDPNDDTWYANYITATKNAYTPKAGDEPASLKIDFTRTLKGDSAKNLADLTVGTGLDVNLAWRAQDQTFFQSDASGAAWVGHPILELTAKPVEKSATALKMGAALIAATAATLL